MTDHKMDGLSPAQKNFLLRHAGDKLTADRMKTYVEAHDRAVAAKLKVDSPRYFKTIAEHVDSLSGSRKAAAEQPSKVRYDGASTPMPRLRGGGDEFHKLRDKASSAYHGKKT
jgi:hypothetical protein